MAIRVVPIGKLSYGSPFDEIQKDIYGYTNWNIGTTRQTLLAAQNNLVQVPNGAAMVQGRLHTLSWRLHHDLSNEIFARETEIKIEHDKAFCDLRSTLVAPEESKGCITAVRVIAGTIKSVSEDDFTKLDREFICYFTSI